MLLTIAAALAAVAAMKWQGISLVGMLASYRAAAHDRGFSAIGIQGIGWMEFGRVVFCWCLLAIPVRRAVAGLVHGLRERQAHTVAINALLFSCHW